jgi:ribosomal protein L3
MSVEEVSANPDDAMDWAWARPVTVIEYEPVEVEFEAVAEMASGFEDAAVQAENRLSRSLSRKLSGLTKGASASPKSILFTFPDRAESVVLRVWYALNLLWRAVIWLCIFRTGALSM